MQSVVPTSVRLDLNLAGVAPQKRCLPLRTCSLEGHFSRRPDLRSKAPREIRAALELPNEPAPGIPVMERKLYGTATGRSFGTSVLEYARLYLPCPNASESEFLGFVFLDLSVE